MTLVKSSAPLWDWWKPFIQMTEIIKYSKTDSLVCFPRCGWETHKDRKPSKIFLETPTFIASGNQTRYLRCLCSYAQRYIKVIYKNDYKEIIFHVGQISGHVDIDRFYEILRRDGGDKWNLLQSSIGWLSVTTFNRIISCQKVLNKLILNSHLYHFL